MLLNRFSGCWCSGDITLTILRNRLIPTLDFSKLRRTALIRFRPFNQPLGGLSKVFNFHAAV
jgi:hypothetical protein